MARHGLRLHPGRVLREEYMEPLHLSEADLAAALDVPQERLHAILEPEATRVFPAAINSDFALRLARCLGTSPQFWLNLQAAHDLSVTQAMLGAEIEARVRPMAA
ncbi:MAG: HigA family addiction module antidote protein [Rhodospirillales bacterium]|nr:HigA family addiction module antidote protein [Rhodospirillales bacterium]